MNAMLHRLRRLQREGRPLDNEDVEYWADRYLALGIERWAGVSLAAYLAKPDYYERIASARRALARRQWPWLNNSGEHHAGKTIS